MNTTTSNNAKTETTLRTDSSQYNKGTLEKQIIHEELNSAENWQVITRAFKEGRARDVADEPKVKDKPPAIVVGSGPSLDDVLPKLEGWKGGIFCTTSHALSLMRYGIEPTHIVALDPFCLQDEIEGVDWSKTKTKLVTHPGVWPSLIANWPNEMLLYRESLGRQDTFYATTQKRQYTWREPTPEGGMRLPIFHFYIPTEVTLFACSPPIQMFFADMFGYGHVFLAGVDFAFHTDKARFTDWTLKDGEWVEHPHPFEPPTEKELSERADLAIIDTANGLKSQQIHLYYKKNMITAWRLSKQTVYTMDHGAITEMPYADVEDVVAKQGRGFKTQSEDFIAKRAEEYLARVGAFVVQTSKGMTFVEANDPPRNLSRFMRDMFAMYHCDSCGIELKSDDWGDHEDNECPACLQNREAARKAERPEPPIGKLHHIHEIDFKKMVRKFQHYMELTGQHTNDAEWTFPEYEKWKEGLVKLTELKPPGKIAIKRSPPK